MKVLYVLVALVGLAGFVAGVGALAPVALGLGALHFAPVASWSVLQALVVGTVGGVLFVEGARRA